MNKKFTAIGAVVLSCSLLFACGKDSGKRDISDNISVADSENTDDNSKDNTKTSAFNPTGKKANSTDAEKTATNKSNTNGFTDGSEHNNVMPSSTVQAELDDAESFAVSEMIDDAREMLSYIDTDSLDDEQRKQYDRISLMLDEEQDGNQNSFTPQEAIDIIRDSYGVSPQGDTSGIRSEFDSDGREYYRMQIEIPSENARKTFNVYKNGEITEISSEPLAFG